MLFQVITLAVFACLTAASPIDRRAGAPEYKPIPANCTVINPLPHISNTTESLNRCGKGLPAGYMPPANFSDNHLVYQAYFDQPFYSPEEQAMQCLQQCFGFGGPGLDCKTAMLAYQVPTPKGWLGTEGGNVAATACMMFDTYLDPNMFIMAPAGQYINETVGNLYCPS